MIKTILQKGWFYWCSFEKLLKKLRFIAITDAQIMDLIFLHKLLKHFPNCHCFINSVQRTMQNQRVNVVSLEIVKRNLEWFPDLSGKVRFGIIRTIGRILSAKRSVFGLDEDLLSRNSRFGNTLPDSSFVVVLWLAGSIDGSESRLESEFDEWGSFFFFPGCSVKDRWYFECFLHKIFCL